MKPRATAPLWAAKLAYATLAALWCVLGGWLWITPARPDPAVLARLIGSGLLLFGTVRLLGYLARNLYRLAFQDDVPLGVGAVLVGAGLLWRPDADSAFLSGSLGVLFLLDALFKGRAARQAGRFGIRCWRWLCLFAAGDLLAALWLLMTPLDSQKALGAALLAEGLLHVGMAAGTIKIIHNQVPDSRDREEVFSCDGPKRW